jgi:membrane protease YdiL (CAAX protease family)
MKIMKIKTEYYYLSILSLIYLLFAYMNADKFLTLRSIIIFIISIIVSILIIDNLGDFASYQYKIPQLKKAIYPFIVIYMINFCFTIFDIRLGINSKYINNTFSKIIAILLITSMIFISYFWKIKISSFNFKLTKEMLILTIIIYLIFIMLRYLGHDTVILDFRKYFVLLLNSSLKLIQPAFVEEYIYRGLLISGLLGLGLCPSKTNILQSFIFGIIHINQYPQFGILCFIPTIAQMLLGFIMGKIYFKTNSLTPCIIFHWLWNINI